MSWKEEEQQFINQGAKDVLKELGDKNIIEEIMEEFKNLFVISHPGDSGIGGNDPQEPIYEILYESPKEIEDFLCSSLQKAINSAYDEGWKDGVNNLPQKYDR